MQAAPRAPLAAATMSAAAFIQGPLIEPRVGSEISQMDADDRNAGNLEGAI